MEPETANTESNVWVDERMASLSPPPAWTPNTQRAYEQVTRRKVATTSWMRLGLAGATLATAAVVVAMLPWSAFWKPEVTGPKAAESPRGAVTAENPKQAAEPQRPESPAFGKNEKGSVSVSSDEQKKRDLADLGKLEAIQKDSLRLRERLQALRAEEASELGERAAAKTALETTPFSPKETGQQAGVTPAVVLSRVTPLYTEEAKMAKIQGTVELDITVNPDGSVTFEGIRSGLGYGLDESSRDAVVQWRFSPATQNGVPIASRSTIAINFSLK